MKTANPDNYAQASMVFWVREITYVFLLKNYQSDLGKTVNLASPKACVLLITVHSKASANL